MSKKRIIVVEDERDMAELIALRLIQEGFLVDTAFDGQEALDRIRSEVPDLVLLDIMMPRMSGMDVIKELRNDVRTRNVPVIMLTAKSDDGDMVEGLQMGADDYVTKPFSMSVLVARVMAVLRRAAAGSGAGEETLTVGILRIDPQRHSVQVAGEPVSLTKTQFRLLLALASARGKILTRNQLIDQTIGLNAMVTDRTIDVHLTALRHKVGAARGYIKTIRSTGYCLDLESDET